MAQPIMFPCALNGELGMAYRMNGKLYRDMTKEPKSRARTIKNGINLIFNGVLVLAQFKF